VDPGAHAQGAGEGKPDLTTEQSSELVAPAANPFPSMGKGQGMRWKLDVDGSARSAQTPTDALNQTSRLHPTPCPRPIEGRGICRSLRNCPDLRRHGACC
jgi:hypothetical protein